MMIEELSLEIFVEKYLGTEGKGENPDIKSFIHVHCIFILEQNYFQDMSNVLFIH